MNMETGFFKWVWRFNGVLLAATCVFLLGILIWETTANWRRAAFPTQTTNTMALTTENAERAFDAPREISRRFGPPFGARRTSLYALPLYIEQEYPNRGISKSSGGNIVNYKIVDTSTQTDRWLFPVADRLVLDTAQLLLPSGNGPSRLAGYVLTVVNTDSNGDGRLSTSDTKSIYLTTGNWNTPKKVTEGVTSTLEYRALSAKTFDLIFNTQAGTHAARVQIPSGALLSEQVFTTRD